MADPEKYPTRIAPYGLRMEPDLKARIQAAADVNHRSMHAEIIARLERLFPHEAYNQMDVLALAEVFAEHGSEGDRAKIAYDFEVFLKAAGADVAVTVENDRLLVTRRNQTTLSF